MILVPLNQYRRRHARAVSISILILTALLLAGFIGRRGYSQAELTFAMTCIIAGVTYASIRDAAGHYAYAIEALKFYRDEDDFAFLKYYARGWRKRVAYLVNPTLAAIMMAAVFLPIPFLLSLVPDALSGPGVLMAGLLFIALFPLALSRLIYFLSPVFVWWRELQVLQKKRPSSEKTPTLTQFIRKLATQDLLVAFAITVALVLPVRHQPEFHPAQGYASLPFLLTALVLVWIVLTFSLISAWRGRCHVCSGELYKLGLAGRPGTGSARSRWVRWGQYVLLMSAYAIVACVLLEACHASALIEIVLLCLLWPIALIFWEERRATLASDFHDALQLVSEFPARMLIPERSELLSGSQ